MIATENITVQNGALVGRRQSDYVAGLVGAIPYEIRNPSGDWTNYLPSTERQHSRRAETMACVSYSLNNVIETQIKFLTRKELNFSDRWLAKMSNTTPSGNYLWAVADTVRKSGLVPQDIWPEPPDYSWTEYYESIPPEIQSKGLDFLQNWNIAYEWIDITPANLLKHLKHAPLQLVIPSRAHAVMEFYQTADVIKYFDTYDPFQRTTTVSEISDALKVIVTPKRMPQFKTQNYKGELRVVLQAASPEEWNALCRVYGLDPKQVSETVN